MSRDVLLLLAISPFLVFGLGVALDVSVKTIGDLFKGSTSSHEANPPSNRETRL